MSEVLTVLQVAERYAVRPGTGRSWIRRGLLAGAYRGPQPGGSLQWCVPATTLESFDPPRGRGWRGWNRNLAERLREVEAERDAWRRRAEIARAGLERIVHSGSRFDPHHDPGWEMARRRAQSILDQMDNV